MNSFEDTTEAFNSKPVFNSTLCPNSANKYTCITYLHVEDTCMKASASG